MACSKRKTTSEMIYNDRLLVVSGGGARGAWGAGFAKFLTNKNGGTYKVGIGTSTGSLMMPFVLTGRFEQLHTAYTTVEQDDVFTVNPFTEKGNLNGAAIERAITLHDTFGDSTNLKTLIRKHLTPAIVEEIRNNPQLDFGIQVVDFKTATKATKFFKQIADYDSLVEWIWASSNQPLLMSYTLTNGGFYVDGGVCDTIPVIQGIDYAVTHNIKAIDVIVNEPNVPLIQNNFVPKNVFNGLLRLVEIWRSVVSADDAVIGMLAAHSQIHNVAEGLELTMHYFPRNLSSGLPSEDLLFDPQKMQEFWRIGEEGKSDSPVAFTNANEKLILDIDFLKTFLKKVNNTETMRLSSIPY